MTEGRVGVLSLYSPERTNQRREGWQDDALCAQTDPDIFMPEKGESNLDAKKVCAACPVIRECFAYVMTNDDILFGVWAGTSAHERRKLRKAAAA